MQKCRRVNTPKLIAPPTFARFASISAPLNPAPEKRKTMQKHGGEGTMNDTTVTTFFYFHLSSCVKNYLTKQKMKPQQSERTLGNTFQGNMLVRIIRDECSGHKKKQARNQRKHWTLLTQSKNSIRCRSRSGCPEMSGADELFIFTKSCC